METLLVTAYLQTGFASADQWSPSLDGILAYWHLREQLGEEEFALGSADPRRLLTPADLPLERETFDEQWWWLCSSPIYDEAAVFERYHHRRFDTLPAEKYLLTGKTGRVDVKSGPYKAYRLQSTVHVTRSVSWHVVGDRAEIERLLRRCTTIGAKAGSGNGRVMRWTVTPDGADEQIARFYRPLPLDYARAHQLRGMPLLWGIRPPGRLPENKCICIMPAPGGRKEEDNASTAKTGAR